MRLEPKEGTRLFITHIPGYPRRFYELDSRDNRIYRLRVRDMSRIQRRTYMRLESLLGSRYITEVIPAHMRVQEGL